MNLELRPLVVGWRCNVPLHGHVAPLPPHRPHPPMLCASWLLNLLALSPLLFHTLYISLQTRDRARSFPHLLYRTAHFFHSSRYYFVAVSYACGLRFCTLRYKSNQACLNAQLPISTVSTTVRITAAQISIRIYYFIPAADEISFVFLSRFESFTITFRYISRLPFFFPTFDV